MLSGSSDSPMWKRGWCSFSSSTTFQRFCARNAEMVDPPGPPPITSTSHWYSGEGVLKVIGVPLFIGSASEFGRAQPRTGPARARAFYRAPPPVQARLYDLRDDGTSGATTPMEMTYLRASSTLMSS